MPAAYTGIVRLRAPAPIALGPFRALRVSPGSLAGPEQLDPNAPGWFDAQVPGTVASSCREPPALAPDLDADDYWYVCDFAAPAGDDEVHLRLEGLATLATVWLNGQLLLDSRNMFVAHEVPVRARLAADNRLAIRFASANNWLEARRPRPRWKTRLVTRQNLRHLRTTLLGRMPGWSPPVAPVGPWKPVDLVPANPVRVRSARTLATLATLQDPATGVLSVDWTLEGMLPSHARCRLGDVVAPLAVVDLGNGGFQLRGEVTLPGVKPWWPHTHGAPNLYDLRVDCEVAGQSLQLDGGRVGFRSVRVERDSDGEGFGLVVNDVPVFCRGACWTSIDMARLDGSPALYRRTLERVVRGGMNMLRVGGTMIYESNAFFDLCDELGILVWHDFMFANMDYPADEPDFMADVRVEAEQFLARVAHRPSLTVLCGGSEVYQQAAMVGLPADSWRNELFETLLPSLVGTAAPGAVYVPNTPYGGALPFRLDRGLGHAYGVGAYLRPLDDARNQAPRFTPECLGFSNVPDEATLNHWLGDMHAPVHSSLYKERVPRDRGAGWDFADVTDHYVRELYGVDVAALRYADMPHYLQLARQAPGEMMAAVTGLWRRPRSPCRGQLVWFLQDLWEGAGWGVLDVHARPKAAYHHLQRAFAPVALWIVDEGLNGLSVELANDTASELRGRLLLELFDADGARLEAVERELTVPAHGHRCSDLHAWLGRFVDATHSYRFGPPHHHLVVATWRSDASPDDASVQAFYTPFMAQEVRHADVGLAGTLRPLGEGNYAVDVSTVRFARSVEIQVRGFVADENYFHLAPAGQRSVVLRPDGSTQTPTGRVGALNARTSSRLALRTSEA